ncbi:hypothetical protein HY572_02310 [Candidatus Micrarchaeota archaeon]|nr:hypothetical protein [Candidatus Micrarchaeota archaeon]
MEKELHELFAERGWTRFNPVKKGPLDTPAHETAKALMQSAMDAGQELPNPRYYYFHKEAPPAHEPLHQPSVEFADLVNQVQQTHPSAGIHFESRLVGSLRILAVVLHQKPSRK